MAAAESTSVIVAVVAATGAVCTPMIQWWRSRHRDTVDLVTELEASYSRILARLDAEINARQEQSAQESAARQELAARLHRAIRRIEHLERLLDANGVQYNGPTL